MEGDEDENVRLYILWTTNEECFVTSEILILVKI